jgi:ribosomal protein S12 methylthiotransferase accessory factor
VAALELAARGPTPIGAALPRLRALLSPYVGIVREAYELMAAPNETRLVSFGCSLARGGPVLGAETVAYTGGANRDRDAALAAALGEAAERYSAAYCCGKQLVRGSAASLGRRAVDPETFALFHPKQYAEAGFRYVPFERDTVVRWTRGWSLRDGSPALLPAQLVYLCAPAADEAAIGYATSNGVACGATLEEAALSALCEVVERDAFVLTWLTRLSLPRLRWRHSPRLVRHDRRFFAPTGLTHTAVDLSVFSGVPAALGVVRGGRALGVGAGCAPTVDEAWQKALSEAFSVHRWVRERCADRPIPDDVRDVASFDDHLLFYARADRHARTAFLDASHAVRDVADVPSIGGGGDVRAQITAIVELLEQRGISAYLVDVTAPDIREAGLHVVRVVAPQLCPLDVAHTARFLGGRRVRHAAFELGLRGRPLAFDEINPDPHPFP